MKGARATQLCAPLRASLYAGACAVLPPTPASEALVARVRARVEATFGTAPEAAHEGHDVHTFFTALTRARAELARDTDSADAALVLLRELGVDEHAYAVDRPRLRGVAPGAHREPVTRDAYALHRDTWYANPRAQINLWIPLRAVSERDGLRIFPDALRCPLPNDSEGFDYAAFRDEGGFQSGRTHSAAVYPRALAAPRAQAFVPAMPRAARLLFSGAQLHGPMPHDEPETRFSVDLRVVHRVDQRRGRGAPQVDDRSRGDASVDYALMGLASVDEALQWARGERA